MKLDDMKDSVGKWYKDRVKDLNVIPPHEAWGNIEKTMEDWPKHWYQSNAAAINSEKDDQSWQAISEQLAMRHNAKVALRNYYFRTASLIAGLVFLPMLIANVGMNPFSDFEVIQGNSPAQANNVVTPSPSNVIELPTTIQNAAPNTFAISNVSLTNANTLLAQNVSNSTAANESVSLATLDIKKASVLSEGNLPVFGMEPRNTAAIRFTEPNENVETPTQKWFIGPTATFGSSKLLNPLSYRDDVATTNSMNLSYGISASRRFNKNMITAEFFLNDNKSQGASLTSEDLTTTLAYTTATLQYERIIPFSKTSALKPELTFGAGIFGSMLSNTLVTSNNTNSYYTGFTYRNFDVGGVLTAGTSVQLGNHFRAGANVRIQSGAINLFEGRAKVPSELFRTQSLATGLQLKLNYAF